MALIWACAAFAMSSLAAVAWAFARAENAHLSPEQVLLYALAGAGPIVTATYAVSLWIADAVLKLLKAQSVAAYTAMVVALSISGLIVPVMLRNPGDNPSYYFLFVLPGALVGGAVLGRRRTRV